MSGFEFVICHLRVRQDFHDNSATILILFKLKIYINILNNILYNPLFVFLNFCFNLIFIF